MIKTEVRKAGLVGEARAFIAQHGENIRWCDAWDAWLMWNGTWWIVDGQGEAYYRAQVFLGDPGAARVSGLLELAKHEPGIAIAPEQLDADPLLFNCLNGTVELASGELREYRREDYITKLAPVEYDPAATSPTWDAFIDRAMNSDAESQAVLQAAAGYLLSGVTTVQTLFCLTGARPAGQVFLDVLSALLGEYAITLPQKVLLAPYREDLDVFFPTLRAARLVTVMDSRDGNLLGLLDGSSRGNHALATRAAAPGFFPFQPQFKLALLCSFSPHPQDLQRLTSAPGVLWNRVIPLLLSAVPGGEELRARLMDELPGVLNWALRGHGRPLPKQVNWQATEMPRETIDANFWFKLGVE